MLEIRPVRRRGEFGAFIRLPRQIYSSMPGFVPPLDLERRDLLDPKRAPFGANGESFRWLAWRGGRPVGRIAAQVDNAAVDAWREPIGCFGALDAVDDPQVVSALLTAAAEQLKGRGMTRMRGPLTPNINGETGVQVEGQEQAAMILMPWHPPYLWRHIELAGLTKAKDVVSYAFGREIANEFIRPLGGAEAEPPRGYRFREIDLRNLGPEIETMRDIYNEAWASNWGFVPVSVAEARYLAKSLRPLITADGVVILEHEGRPIAAALILPNLFDYIGDMGGRLAPFNWLRLLWRVRRRRFKSVRVILFGMLPDAGGALIVPTLMFRELFRRAARYDLEFAEMGWVLEDKTTILRGFERNGGVMTTRHRIYEAALT